MEYPLYDVFPVLREAESDYDSAGNFDSKSPLTLVYVDDNLTDVWLAERVCKLSGFEGEILTATNGNEGFQLILKHLIDKGKLPEVIIADVQMPIEDGLNLMKKVKELSVFADDTTKLILISSQFNEEELRIIREMGITCLLKKPLNEQDLANILKK